MDVLGGLKWLHTTLYLQERVRMLLKKVAKLEHKSMSRLANEILWAELCRRFGN